MGTVTFDTSRRPESELTLPDGPILPVQLTKASRGSSSQQSDKEQLELARQKVPNPAQFESRESFLRAMEAFKAQFGRALALADSKGSTPQGTSQASGK